MKKKFLVGTTLLMLALMFLGGLRIEKTQARDCAEVHYHCTDCDCDFVILCEQEPSESTACIECGGEAVIVDDYGIEPIGDEDPGKKPIKD